MVIVGQDPLALAQPPESLLHYPTPGLVTRHDVVRLFFSPIRRMSRELPPEAAASRPVGLSYPSFRHKFCGAATVGWRRSTTTASIVARSHLQSGTFAPSMTTPNGRPALSTSRLVLVPGLPQSVRSRLTFPPQTGPCPVARWHSATTSPPRSCRHRWSSGGPTTAQRSRPGSSVGTSKDGPVAAEVLRQTVPLTSRPYAEVNGYDNLTKAHQRSFHGLGRVAFVEQRLDDALESIR